MRELRRQGSNLLFAINSRASYPFDLAGMEAEGEGVEPSTAEAAPVFETGYRASGSPSRGGPGRSRTCNPPIKSRQLCRFELRSHEVWPAGIEPAARRVSGDRSTVLSYGHARVGKAGLEPAASCL